VVLGNATIWGISIVALGFGVYKKHSEGKLDLKLAGTVAGVVGLFGVADYYVSLYVFTWGQHGER
jgi:Family of unknown function (DUF5353)